MMVLTFLSNEVLDQQESGARNGVSEEKALQLIRPQ